MRRCATFLCCLGLLSVLGCERRIPKDELGTVVFEVPAVPGADEPPPTPELKGLKDQEQPPSERH